VRNIEELRHRHHRDMADFVNFHRSTSSTFQPVLPAAY
jgi:hypothetical protein